MTKAVFIANALTIAAQPAATVARLDDSSANLLSKALLKFVVVFVVLFDFFFRALVRSKD